MLRQVFSPGARAVAQREWRQYLESPLGVVFSVIFLGALAHLSFEPGRGSLFVRGQADLLPVFDHLPWLFAFFIPALAMRTWAEERKSGTIELLLTLPLPTLAAVWGKFWAAWKLLGLILLGTFPLPLTVAILGSPDWSAIFTGYLGAWLLAGQMLALALLASASSKGQVTSFILGSLVNVVFLLWDAPALVDLLNDVLPSFALALLENLSLLRHFDPWVKGVVRLGGVLQALGLMSVTLWLTAQLIERVKAR